MQVCLDLGWLGKGKGGGLVFGLLGSHDFLDEASPGSCKRYVSTKS